MCKLIQNHITLLHKIITKIKKKIAESREKNCVVINFYLCLLKIVCSIMKIKYYIFSIDTLYHKTH